MKHTAYLSLGSNMGERAYYLQSAMQMIQGRDDMDVLAVSSVYETKPVDYEQQPDFLNLVCRIRTHLGPYALLDAMQIIENSLDRRREERFGPRTIDIDILTYDALRIDQGRLILPHPRMNERAFVIIPLLEIAPEDFSEQALKGEVRYIGKLEEVTRQTDRLEDL